MIVEKLVTNKYVLLGAGVGLVVALYLAKRGADALGKGLEAVNPLDNDNIINQGVTDVYQTVTGSSGTIGGDIYDATYGGALDVTSGNNVVNQTAQGIYQWLTGSKGTIGGDIYDWTH